VSRLLPLLAVLLAAPAVAAGPDASAGGDAGIAPPEPAAPGLPADRMPTLSLEVEPPEAAVGEVIRWRLSVKRRIGDRVYLGSGASFGDLEVRKKEINPGQSSGDWIDETMVVELIGFEPAEVEIPPQKLTVVDAEGRLAEIETAGATVRVTSLIANEPEPQLKPDEGPGEVVMEKDYTLLWILGILGGAGVVALLTLLGRWLWSKRRPRPEPPPPPPRPAEEIALEKLLALERSTLLDTGEIKEFHVRLSEAIREYLGNRYRFDSLELSTEELVARLKRATIGKSELALTIDFLGETDLVKFAKALPTLEESRDLLKKSIDFVKRTTPRPADGAAVSGGDASQEGATDA
jgi:hypothetical protein